MIQVAQGVLLLRGHPHYYLNTYIADGILIDAATRFARGRLLRQVAGKSVRMVALTHCHPDHQGCVKAVCEKLRVPLACHELDVPAMEGRASMLAGRPDPLLFRFVAGPPHPVSQVLRDGDELGSFRVVHAPGHTPGHVLFFRPTDRLVIAGDILANINMVTGRPSLREPPRVFSANALQNRRSLMILRDLKPSIVCFGHGPPLRDMDLLNEFIEVRIPYMGLQQSS